MGNCFTRCFGGREARRFARNMYYDRANSVEFESLMDENPRDEPLSDPVISEFEKCVLVQGNYDVLVSVQNEADEKLFFEMTRHEEMLELEEEAYIDARREAVRVARFANNRQQIINPARLLLRSTCSFDSSRFRDDEMDWNTAEMLAMGGDSESLSRNLLRSQINRGFMPDCRSRTESTSSNGNGSHVSRDRAATNTPPSSVDLEWEHEAGFYLAPGHMQKTEDELTATAGSDKCTTPLSTDLEWDDGFASPDIVDLETEQLINEIELLTSEALRETGAEVNGDVDERNRQR